MPCIQAKVSTPVTPQQEKALKQRFGEAITVFPGKSEAWLMVEIESGCHLYFKGDNSAPCAFVEVKILGTSTRAYFEKMTKEVCAILEEELGIPAGRTYVKYEEVEHWGYNGGNF